MRFWFLDSGHNDKKISFLDTELIEFISIGGGLALEYNFLGIYLKSFLIFDFGFEVKNCVIGFYLKFDQLAFKGLYS